MTFECCLALPADYRQARYQTIVKDCGLKARDSLISCLTKEFHTTLPLTPTWLWDPLDGGYLCQRRDWRRFRGMGGPHRPSLMATRAARGIRPMHQLDVCRWTSLKLRQWKPYSITSQRTPKFTNHLLGPPIAAPVDVSAENPMVSLPRMRLCSTTLWRLYPKVINRVMQSEEVHAEVLSAQHDYALSMLLPSHQA